MNTLFQSFSNLIYPNLCFQCEEALCKDHKIFCKNCWSMLNWAEPKGRCPRCFDYSCKNCKRSLIYKRAYLFDYETSAATWVQQFKNHGKYYLAEGAGAFLAWQFLKLQWPKPDLIVAVPSSFIRNWKRGYQASELMAKTMGKILGIPTKRVLKKSFLAVPQSRLNRKERLGLKKGMIYLKKGAKIADLNVLLIDDVLTTGSSLERSAQALQEGFVQSIYAMSFCRTEG